LKAEGSLVFLLLLPGIADLVMILLSEKSIYKMQENARNRSG